eukprot:1160205-Pelagomonas_calceolata.AAC.3
MEGTAERTALAHLLDGPERLHASTKDMVRDTRRVRYHTRLHDSSKDGPERLHASRKDLARDLRWVWRHVKHRCCSQDGPERLHASTKDMVHSFIRGMCHALSAALPAELT